MTMLNNMQGRVVRGGWLALALVVGGCSQVHDLQDLREYVQETRTKPSGTVDPLPEFKSYETYLYRATSLRGPFEPLVRIELSPEEVLVKNDLKPDFERPKEPLEAFKFETLVMVGTIHMTATGELTGLVRDGNGEIHRVRIGNHIGRNYGAITQVSETQVDVVEIVPDGRGGWTKRPRNLVLLEKDS